MTKPQEEHAQMRKTGALRRQVIKHRIILGLAVAQICLALVTICAGILPLALIHSSEYKVIFTHSGAMDAWTTIVFLGAGLTGILTWKFQKREITVAHMVLCYASVLSSGILSGVAIHYEIKYGSVFLVLLASFASVEFVVSILSSIACTKMLCCHINHTSREIRRTSQIEGIFSVQKESLDTRNTKTKYIVYNKDRVYYKPSSPVISKDFIITGIPATIQEENDAFEDDE